MEGCIISNECLTEGYPRIKVDGKYIRLNRYTLEQKLGRLLKEGYWALHTCNNRACINPDHLYEGDQFDNNLDILKTGNTLFYGNYQKLKTHCPQGHEYNAEHTKIDSRGHRFCRTCRVEWNRKKRLQ